MTRLEKSSTATAAANPSAVTQQLVAIETRYGAEALACTVLRALRRTIQMESATQAHSEIYREARTIYDLLWNGKPKMAAPIHDVQKLLAWLLQSPTATRDEAIAQIDQLLEERADRLRRLALAGAPLIATCDTLFVCSYSGTVHAVLDATQRMGAKPRVLIASQEDDESARIASTVQGMSLTWELIDPGSLSHFIEEIDIALCGSVALSGCESVIVRAGTAGLLAQLHDAEKPIYFALASDKFTDWKRSSSTAPAKVIETSRSHIVLKKHSFSHEYIGMDVVAGLITEVGVLTNKELPQLLEARQREFRARDALIQNATAA